MKLKQLTVATLAVLSTGAVLATPAIGLPPPLPIEDGGMLALAAACLAIGIRIARRK